MTGLDPKTARDIFASMLRIRRVQERIEAEYLNDEMQTPVHLYIGQEAIAAGVCATLGREDYVSSNHRSHGHYLAKGGDLNALIAELHCRETGCSKGRGGSMHVVDISVGHLGSSSIVGGGIPIGTGLGLAAKMQGSTAVSVVFFGDGAADEGVLYESINFAVLRKLPVIYVLENNHYSVCSPVAARQAWDNIFHHAPGKELFHAKIDGNDPALVYNTAAKAVARARAGDGPSFIECLTYRILGHAGAKSQDAKGYRDPAEIEAWAAKCPLDAFTDRLMDQGIIDAPAITAMEAEIAAAIDAAFAFAKASPFPAPDTLGDYLFRE